MLTTDSEIYYKPMGFIVSTLRKLLKFSVYARSWPLIIFRFKIESKHFSGTFFFLFLEWTYVEIPVE